MSIVLFSVPRSHFVVIAIRASLAVLLSIACAAGCSRKPERRADTPGNDPKVRLAVDLPVGRYAGTANASVDFSIQPERGSGTRINVSVLMELAMMAEQSGEQKTGRLNFTRVKFNGMGLNIDTNTPLPPEQPAAEWGSIPRLPEPEDRTLVVRRMLAKMIGPELVWVMSPNGTVTTVLKNDLANSNKNPVEAMQAMNSDYLAEVFCGHYPDHPVGVGAIWHFSAEREVPGSPVKVPMEVEYELTDLQDGPNGKIATVRCYTNLCRDISVTRSGVTARNVDITATGSMRIEVKTGLILERDDTLSGWINLQTGGGSAKVTMNSKSIYSAKPVR